MKQQAKYIVANNLNIKGMQYINVILKTKKSRKHDHA